MRTALISAVVLLLAGTASARQIRILFVNQTQDLRFVTISTPAESRIVGSFTRGGSMSAAIWVDDNVAAYEVGWAAGNQSGTFVITPNTPDSLRIDLRQERGQGDHVAHVVDLLPGVELATGLARAQPSVAVVIDDHDIARLAKNRGGLVERHLFDRPEAVTHDDDGKGALPLIRGVDPAG